MSNSIRLILVALAALMMAACASNKPVETTDEPVQEPSEPYEPETTPADPSDPNVWFEDPASIGMARFAERTIYFDFDQSDIKSQYRDVLRVHGEFMKRFGDRYSMTLEGHADERGTREYNLGLGERRNTSVSNFLSTQGAGGADGVSYGEERPVCTQSDESCWQRNRRVEIVYEAR